MVHVGIYTANQHGELGWTRVATITADGDMLSTDGDAAQLEQVLTLTVPHPTTPGATFRREDGAEAWAAGLPATLRGPAVIARLEPPETP